MTDTQADLTERARAIADEHNCCMIDRRDSGKPWCRYDTLVNMIAAALQSEREAAIDHLRNALYLFADIHPDYTSKSFRNALEFYNAARPGRKVEPSGFELRHFVTESAIQGRCETAAAEARRAALEECAQIADYSAKFVDIKPHRIKFVSPEQYAADLARDIADGIRARINFTTRPTGG